MFKHDSTDNLLDNLEQELKEIEESPKKTDFKEPPIQQTKLFDPFEEPTKQPKPAPKPKPKARQRTIITTSSITKSLEKNEKNDENEIIQLSSISSDILKSSQSSPTISDIKNNSQTSSFYSGEKTNDTVVMINEKQKSPKTVDVKVVHEANQSTKDPDESFFVIKHGKWANDSSKSESSKSVPKDDPKIEEKAKEKPQKTPEKQKELKIEERLEKPKKVKKEKRLKHKKVSTSTSSVTSSLATSTVSSSSEEDSPEPKKKHPKPKKSKDTKAKKKSKKRESSGEEEATEASVTEDSVVEAEEDDVEVASSNAIGIYIHDTGLLEYQPNLKSPKVKVSFYNEDNGNKINKISKKTPIESIFSKKGSLNDDFFDLHLTWNELLILEEDAHRLKELYNNVLIFFEILNENDENLCWAFLKFFSPKFINIDQKFQLQLYHYRKRFRSFMSFHAKKDETQTEFTIYEQWQLNDRKKKNSFLNVSVNSIQVNKKEEREDLKPVAETDGSENQILFSNWKKLPGQACKIPNKLIHKIILHEKGSMNVRFSFDGNFLAFTEVQKNNFVLHVTKFPEMTEAFTMREHTDLIHDLDWLKQKAKDSSIFPQHLLSCSSDYTSIVWKLESSGYTYSILPHPCYVYCSKYLQYESPDKIFIATGGRDSILRIWKSKKKKEGFELYQELIPANDSKNSIYITGIAAKTNEYFYSSNSVGQIFEWKFDDKSYNLNRKFDLVELSNKIITCIDLHSRGNKLYIKVYDFTDINNTNNNAIYILGIPSGLIIQKFRINDTSSNFVNFGLHSKLRCSPQNEYIFSTDLANKERINYYYLVNGNINTNELSDKNFLHAKFHLGEKNFISSIDYHPRDFYLAYSIYGKSGGIGIYGFKRDSNEKLEEIQQKPQNENIQKWKLAQAVEHSGKTTEIKHFSDIIRRLDEVFLIPNDLRRIGLTEKPEDSAAGELSEKENNTFTVNSKVSKTFTVSQQKPTAIEKPSKNDSDNNLTFSIKNNNTYEIQKNQQSDDTTISESLN